MLPKRGTKSVLEFMEAYQTQPATVGAFAHPTTHSEFVPTGELCGGAARANAQLIDPLLFLVAEGYDDLSGETTTADPHRLLFVVLAYPDLVQIVIRLGADAHLSVALSPGVDPHLLGTKLLGLLDRLTQQMILN